MKRTKPIKKIQFITSPFGVENGTPSTAVFSVPPVTYLWLSGYLEQQGFECRILDAYTKALPLEDILADIEAFRPDVVGFSVFTVTWYDNEFLAKKIKERFPDILVIMGGYHVDNYPEEVLGSGVADFAVFGEGDVTAHELFDCLNEGGDPHRINGLGFMEDGRMTVTEPRGVREELDPVPRFPFEKLLDYYYVPWCFTYSSKDRFMATTTSRGCPNQCVFCDIGKSNGRRFRAMSPARVVDDMEYMHNELGVTQLQFIDPLFTTSNKRVIEICKVIKERGLKMEWACSSAIRFSENQEMLDLMGETGCKAIFYGVESGDPEILMQVKKCTLDQVRKVMDMTRKAGILPHASYIFGLPNDTPETMQRTLDFAKSLNTDSASFSIALPYKGTALYELYKDRIFITDYRQFQQKAIFRADEYTPEFLEAFFVKAHREYYLRLRYILLRLSRIRSWRDLKLNISIGLGFLGGKIRYKLFDKPKG